jgi:hypothetical protein
LLHSTPNSNGHTLLCDTIDDALATVETAQVDLRLNGSAPTHAGYTVIVQRWRRLPHQEALVTDLLGHLSRIALGLWPRWYGFDDLSTIQRFSTTLHVESQVQMLLRHLQTHASFQAAKLSLSWLQAAAERCRQGQAPVLARLSTELQLAQLACAIEPKRLIILLAVDDPQPPPFHLYGLARALPWLANATTAQVALLVPAALADHAELESVLYDAIHLTPLPATVKPPAIPAVENDDTEQQKEVIWPIRGRPHPFSPGEQRLAAQLAQEPDLASLFLCNAWVDTIRGSHYLADLLWPAGQVVVEVDGYHVHSKRPAFHADRQRDYELLISGYLVLRLSHDEVMQDVALAVHKIRDVVCFRKATLSR